MRWVSSRRSIFFRDGSLSGKYPCRSLDHMQANAYTLSLLLCPRVAQTTPFSAACGDTPVPIVTRSEREAMTRTATRSGVLCKRVFPSSSPRSLSTALFLRVCACPTKPDEPDRTAVRQCRDATAAVHVGLVESLSIMTIPASWSHYGWIDSNW